MGLYAMTGGATGIGEAIKLRLKKEGRDVVVVDIRDADIIADLSTGANWRLPACSRTSVSPADWKRCPNASSSWRSST